MYAINRKDAGTPPAQGEAVTLTIDGAEVTVPAGTSVMRAAAAAGGAIPKLCATDTLKAFGSCRVCLVEIEGQRGYPASCTTLVAPGMKVRTQSDKLRQLRKGVVELYVSDHPLDCKGCPADTHCELQSVAARARRDRQPATAVDGANHLDAPCDDSNPYFEFDPSLCIVCSRCVRACDEVQGTFALTIEGRGFASRVVASQDQSFLDSECVSCGACVESCPTAALSEKPLAIIGPARTRPSPPPAPTAASAARSRPRSRASEVVRMVPSRDGKANHGHACVKGRFAYGYATHADRITTPMIRKADHRPLAAR